MATAFTQAEHEYFCRLVVLIKRKGLDAMRASLEFFSTKRYNVNVATFQDVLRDPTVKVLLEKLRKRRVISPDQWDILYPPSGAAVTVTELDLTLCFILIKSITGLRQPMTSWNKPPSPYDNSLEGGLAQINFLRNMLCHKDSPKLTDVDFRRFYRYVEKALLDIDHHLPSWNINKAEIQKFRHIPISPQQEREVHELVKTWYYQEWVSLSSTTDKKLKEIILPSYRPTTKERAVGRPLTKRKYLQHLKRHYRPRLGKIQRIPWEEDDTFDIQDIFVNQVIVDRRTGNIEKELDHYSQMITKGKCVKVIVQGDAGMGKTTLVSKLAVDWANGDWNSFPWWKDHFPLILKLRDLSFKESLSDAIKKQLFNGLNTTSKEIFEFLCIYSNQIVLILDGFDEFSYQGSPETMALIKGEWFRDMSVILTTRPWRTREVQDSWDKIVEITGFKKKDINAYIDNFFMTIPDGKTISMKLMQEIEKEQLYPILRTPLAVLFNCLIFLDEGKIYRHLTDHCRALVTCIKRRAIARDYNLYSENSYEIIEDLAFQGLLTGDKGLIFSAEELAQKPDKGYENLESAFRHKTLQEYLAACSLVRRWHQGNNTVLQEVEKYCETPRGILQMGKLLQFCCSLSKELKRAILPWFRRNLQLCYNSHISPENMIVIQLTKETSDICQAYSSCFSDYCKDTEELVKAREQFIHIAEKYNYSILVDTDSGNIIGITSGDQNKLMENSKTLIKERTDVDESDQVLVFDCNFSSHTEYETLNVIHYMALCKSLKKIRITSLKYSGGSFHPLSILLDVPNPHLEELIIPGNNISDDLSQALSRYIRALPKLKKLDVGSNKIYEKIAKELGESFRFIPNLEELIIEKNQISTKGWSHLVKNFKSVPRLRKIDAGFNNIEDEVAKVMAEYLNFVPNLEELIMTGNEISTNGFSYIVKYLKSVPKLKKLDFGWNNVDDAGVKVLREHFQFIPHLEELGLQENLITSKGCFQLATHLKLVPRLKSLDIDSSRQGETKLSKDIIQSMMIQAQFLLVADKFSYSSLVDRDSGKLFGLTTGDENTSTHLEHTNVLLRKPTENDVNEIDQIWVFDCNFAFHTEDEIQGVLSYMSLCKNLKKIRINSTSFTKGSRHPLSQLWKALTLQLEELMISKNIVPKLKKLDVSSNNLGVEGAKELGESFQFIPNLEELIVDKNQISTKGWSHLVKNFKSVPRLRKIDAGFNNIEDEGAKVMAEYLHFVPNLEELIMTGNELSNKGLSYITTGLKSILKLKKLHIGGNTIEEGGAKELGESFHVIANLEELIMRNNQISTKGCASLARNLKAVPKLKKLDLSSNKIGDIGAKVLAENLQFLQNLEELVIFWNSLSSKGCSYLARNLESTQNLKKLDVGSNMIGKEGAKVLGENFHRIRNLEELNIERNGISTEGISSIAVHFKSVPRLRIFDVGWNSIGEEGAKILGENFQYTPNLEELIIPENSFATKGCSLLAMNLKFTPKLKKLNVGSNKIRKEGARVLGENFRYIPELEDLFIFRNNILDRGCSDIAKHLKSVPKIKKLDVGWNRLGEEGAKVLGENLEFIPNLKELILEGNNMSTRSCSHLAKHLKSVPRLKKLGVGCNKIGDEEVKMLIENLHYGCRLENE